MRRRDFLFGAAGATGALGLLFGTGAFSSTQAEREVTVEVVGDDEAYVELQDLTNESDGDVISPTVEEEHVDLLKIRNRFGTGIRIENISSDSRLLRFEYNGLIPPGETEVVGATVHLNEDDSVNGIEEENIEFEIEIEATNGETIAAEAKTTRTLDIEIGGTAVQNMTFTENGNGTLKIESKGPATSLRARVWGDDCEYTGTTLSVNDPNPVQQIDIEKPATAVRFLELNQLFIRDGVESDKCDFEE